jgi:ABC-type branched-subunit amino acid transport system ATPase component/MFS family permease
MATPDVDVAEIELAREALRDDARRAVGVVGEGAEPQAPLRKTFAQHGVTFYPLIALGLLGVVDQFHGYAFAVLAPEISRTLGIGKGAIAGLVALKTLALALAPLPMAALMHRRQRRALLCVATAVTWSIVGIGTGFTISLWGLLLVLLADGLSSGSIVALHLPLLLDSYPTAARVRVLSGYQGFTEFGAIVAPVLVAVLVTVFNLTWRGVFATLGAVSLAVCVVALRLRDPGFGRWDTQQVRAAVRARHGDDAPGALDGHNVTLGFFEIVRRVLLIPSVRRLMAALAVLGLFLIPYQTFLFFFLSDRWDMSPGGRGVFYGYLSVASIGALATFGRWGERRFRENPGTLARLAGALFAVAVTLIALGGLVPWFWAMVALFGLSSAIVSLVPPALNAALFSVVPAEMRPHAAAIGGIFTGGVGGVAGALFLSGIDSRFGATGSMVVLFVPGMLGAALLASTGRLVPRDLDRMIDDIIEDEEIRHVRASGGHLPMLACRGVDFSYGQVQVLFDIDFTVDDGEMVALLGVNGAGKSTLLKVVSGIGLPSAGSVRFRGADITYLDAERRLGLGITQVPGGRAVFAPLTVVENMRGFGYTLGRDSRALDAAIDRCFEAFPRLADRRNQSASTLSGGEQQMLGLSKALILQPRLLLIDELSLGLAPVVVAQLLQMVRQINRDGTAVVLVEQSVNIALNLVDHAYFMEKGEIRFDGRADELVARDDLLRAVFLQGTAGTAPRSRKR